MFAGIEPWRSNLYPDTAIHIPVHDATAWQTYLEHRWVYDRLRLALSLDMTAAPCGVPTDIRPVVIKPITNLWRVGGSELIEEGQEIPHRVGWFWMPYFRGRHLSTDIIVSYGKLWWQATAEAEDSVVFGQPRAWHLLSRPTGVNVSGLSGFRGVMNIESIDGQVIGIHLRPSNHLVDLYPDWFAETLIEFYSGKPWPEFVKVGDKEFARAGVKEGWSVPVWGAPGAYLRKGCDDLPEGCWLSGDSPEAALSTPWVLLGYGNARLREGAEAKALQVAQCWAKKAPTHQGVV